MEKQLLKEIEHASKENGENARETLTAYWHLAQYYMDDMNDTNKAYDILLKRYNICMNTYEKSYFEKAHYLTLSCISTLGQFEEEKRHNFIKAEEWYQVAIQLCKQHLVPYHQSTSSMIYQLARFYCRQHRLKEAERLYLNVIESCQQTVGERTEFTLDAMKEMVIFYTEHCHQSEENNKDYLEQSQYWQTKVEQLKWLV